MKRDIKNSVSIFGNVCDVTEISESGPELKYTFHILPCFDGSEFKVTRDRLMDIIGTPYREFKIKCVLTTPEKIKPKEEVLKYGSAIRVVGDLIYEPDMLVGRAYKDHNAFSIQVELILDEYQKPLWVNLPF